MVCTMADSFGFSNTTLSSLCHLYGKSLFLYNFSTAYYFESFESESLNYKRFKKNPTKNETSKNLYL